MKYPCETCEHYRPKTSRDCSHPKQRRWQSAIAARAYFCRNGRRHSAYVSVLRRVWRWVAGKISAWNYKRKYFDKKNQQWLPPEGSDVDKWEASGVTVGYDPASQTPVFVRSDGTVIDFETKEHVAGSWR